MNKTWQKCQALFGWLRDRSRVDMKVFVVAISFVIVSSMVIGYMVSSAYHNSQLRILYSLDKRQNDKEIVRLIDEADKYIYFAIYFFTKENIASALIRAKERGVIVWGITDRGASLESNEKIVNELRKAGISVEVQRHEEGIMHLKTIVTEKAYASGSYNWTSSATVINDEILEIGKNNSVRKKYLAVIQKLLIKNQSFNGIQNK
jgi:phosphatidylserine/phosphatidylglycerophosphate/cardiolipin synthase-like enzyme